MIKLLFAVRAAACLLIALTGSTVHAEEPGLMPGAYEVKIGLLLANLPNPVTNKAAMICIGDGKGNAGGLRVLSDNNPLTVCPISNVHRDSGVLTFDIICPGINTAIASARYVIAQQSFEGRIAMKMGGKNMTMTEYQEGHRIGDCDAAGPPRP